MRELKSDIVIDAPAETIWGILSDFASFPDWNPFMVRIAGELREGEKLEVYLQMPEGKGMTFKPKLIKVEPNREFRWLGRFLMLGIADGLHIIKLEPMGDGQTKVIHREEFRGILTSLFLAMVEKKTKVGFQQMNEALKARAESMATSGPA